MTRTKFNEVHIIKMKHRHQLGEICFFTQSVENPTHCHPYNNGSKFKKRVETLNAYDLLTLVAFGSLSIHG